MDYSPPGSSIHGDSPSKNTGVGCHFLLQCMKVKSESEGAQSFPTLRDPMDCSPPGSSIHGIFQARVLGRVPVPSPQIQTTIYKINKVLLCSIGNYIQYSAINHKGKEYEKEYIKYIINNESLYSIGNST